MRLTQNELIEIIRGLCKGRMQCEVAVDLCISPTYLSDVLRGKRDVSDQLAKKLGFERQVRFVRIDSHD